MSDTKNEVVGCVSSIRKWLLCTCIPTRTFDFKQEANGVEVEHSEDLITEKVNVGSVSPGIVARLMGPESMPEASLVPKYRPIDSFLPRRSADSIYNHPGKLDSLVHRQVGASLSFRDMPTYLQADVKEFFLARAENIWQKKTRGSKDRKYEITGRAEKQRVVGGAKSRGKEKPVLNDTIYNENDYMRMLITGRPVRIATTPSNSRDLLGSSQGKISNHVTAADRITFPKKHTSRYLLPKEKAERKSKLGISAKEKCSNLTKKQPVDFPESKYSPGRHSIRNVKSVNIKRQSCDRCTKSTKSVSYLKSKRDALKLAKEDLKRLLSKPRETWKQVTTEEIGIEFEAMILDGLVHEIVAELWGLHLNNVAYKK